MRKRSADKPVDAFYTLSGDVNSDMVKRVFEQVASMTAQGVTDAHVLVQSNGGYVSDGICLYNFLSRSPIKFTMYNGGAVASIAVVVFLAGMRRMASDTARFMIHKSHASAASGTRPDALQIIVDGLVADDHRTEKILKKHVKLTKQHWKIHVSSDLHLTAAQALEVGIIDQIADFAPPKGSRIVSI